MKFEDYVNVPKDVDPDSDDPTLPEAMRVAAIGAMSSVYLHASMLEPGERIGDVLAAERSARIHRELAVFGQFDGWCDHVGASPTWLLQVILVQFFFGTSKVTREDFEAHYPGVQDCRCPDCSGVTWDFTDMIVKLKEMESEGDPPAMA